MGSVDVGPGQGQPYINPQNLNAQVGPKEPLSSLNIPPSTQNAQSMPPPMPKKLPPSIPSNQNENTPPPGMSLPMSKVIPQAQFNVAELKAKLAQRMGGANTINEPQKNQVVLQTGPAITTPEVALAVATKVHVKPECRVPPPLPRGPLPGTIAAQQAAAQQAPPTPSPLPKTKVGPPPLPEGILPGTIAAQQAAAKQEVPPSTPSPTPPLPQKAAPSVPPRSLPEAIAAQLAAAKQAPPTPPSLPPSIPPRPQPGTIASQPPIANQEPLSSSPPEASKLQQVTNPMSSELLSRVTSAADSALKELPTGQDYANIQEDGRTFLANRNPQGTLFLHEIGIELGHGGFGVVFELADKDNVLKLSHTKEALKAKKSYTPEITDTPEAIREARREAILRERVSMGVRDIKNEVDLLTKLHALGPVYGLQDKPSKVVHLDTGQVGYISKRCDGDLFKNLYEGNGPQNRTLNSSIAQCHGLLGCLQFLAGHNVVHGDLKPENIFLKDGHLKIADMGGARDLKGLGAFSLGAFKPSTSTPEYISLEEMNSAKTLYKIIIDRPPLSLDDPIIKALEKLKKSIDVFQAGTIMYEMFSTLAGRNKSDCLPFPLNDSKHPVLYVEYRNLPESIPSAINDLIKDMLSQDPENRPTAAQAFEILNKYIDSDPNSSLFATIQNNMKGFVTS